MPTYLSTTLSIKEIYSFICKFMQQVAPKCNLSIDSGGCIVFKSQTETQGDTKTN